jgi:hypothetical protein
MGKSGRHKPKVRIEVKRRRNAISKAKKWMKMRKSVDPGGKRWREVIQIHYGSYQRATNGNGTAVTAW